MAPSSYDDDDDYESDRPQQTSGTKKKRAPPAEPRKLMRWNPDADQLTLLAVDAVCTRLGVALPWDEIAKDVEPFLSGEGVKQHLGKLRLAREATGRKVPPKPEKGSRRKGRKNKGDGDDDEDGKLDEAIAAKLAGLLYHGPEVTKKKKEPKTPKKAKADETPATTDFSSVAGTPVNTGDGKSKGPSKKKRAKSTLDREAVLGSVRTDTGTPTTQSTGKRGRKSRAKALKNEEDDEEELEPQTPSKRQKTYGLRAATSDVNYNEAYNSGDDEDLLADPNQGNEEAGDDDYEDEGAGADMMEGVKDEKVPRAQYDAAANMTPPARPPQFNLQSQSVPMNGYAGLDPQSRFYHNPNSTPYAKQPLPFNGNPASGAYGQWRGYGNMPNSDPFSNNIPNAPVTGQDWIVRAIMPQPKESAMRSSIYNPKAANKDGSASKAEEKKDMKTPRKDSAKKEKKSTEKKKQTGNTNQAGTPAPKITADPTHPRSLPKEAAEANKAIFESSSATLSSSSAAVMSDMPMNNYTYSQANPMNDYFMNGVGGGMMAGSFGMPNLNVSNGGGQGQIYPTGMHNTHLGGLDIFASPEEHGSNAGTQYAGLSAPMGNNTYTSAPMGGLPSYGGSGYGTKKSHSGPTLSQTSHSGSSFGSQATVAGSQTDEASTLQPFDVAFEPQAQGVAVDMKMNETQDDIFGDLLNIPTDGMPIDDDGADYFWN